MIEIMLDEVCDFINGGAWSDKEYVEKGIPVLKVSNCKSSGYSLSEINYLPFESAEKYAKNKLLKNDVIIATVGSHPNLKDSAAGRSCIVNSIVEGYFLNQNAVCLRSKDTDVLDQTYLGYLTKHYIFQNYIQMRGRGAANQMRIAISAIKSYKLYLPDIVHQKRVADMLYAYDKLIENNQKQVILLEEIAQRIFNEWFVKLHYTGYENDIIVHEIPKGWHLGSLGEIAYESGKKVKKEKRNNFMYYLPIDCFPKKSLAYFERKSINEAESSLVSFTNGDILFGAMRPYFHKVVIARENGLTRSTCFVLNAIESEYWAFLLMLLFSSNSINYATKISVGTTMPYVRWKDFCNMPVLIPDKNCAKQFYNLTEPMISKIKILSEEIIKLQQARDRLLPKLMSGELEV